MVTAAADVVIRGKFDNQTQAGLAEMQRDMKDAETKATKAMGKHSEDHFKRIFSDQSTTGLDPLGRGLAGALSEHLGSGVAIGLTAVGGKLLADMTGKMVEFNDRLREGQMGAADIALEFGKCVPLLGSFVEAGANIREYATGAKNELREINELTAAINANSERQLHAAIEIKSTRMDQLETLRAINREAAGTGLRGSESERFGFGSHVEAAREAAEKKKQEAKDSFTTDAGRASAEKAVGEFNEKHGQRIADILENVHAQGGTADAQGNVTWQAGSNTQMSGGQLAELKQLRDRESTVKAGRESANTAAATKRDEAIRAADDEFKATEGLGGKKAAEFEKRNSERLALEREGHVASLNQITAAAAAELAAVAGHAEAARRAEIQAGIAGAEAHARLDAQTRTNATTDASERATIETQLQETLYGIAAKGDADLAAAAKEAGAERVRLTLEAGRAETDAAASANAQRIREAGGGYEADRQLRAAELKRAKDQIDADAEAKIKQNSDNADAIRRDAAAQKSKLDTQNREQERQAAEGERQGHLAVRETLTQGRIDALKEESKYGNGASGYQAKQLEIAKAFLDKKEKLTRLIKDTNTTGDEKAKAQAELGGLDAQEKRAQGLVGVMGGGHLAGLNMSRGSGAAARAEEQASPFLAQQRELNKSNQELIAATKALTAAIARGNPPKSVFNGPVR